MTTFSYPDILATRDRELYAHLTKVNTLLKHMGRTINNLETQVVTINKELENIKNQLEIL